MEQFERKQNDLNEHLKNIKSSPTMFKTMVNDIVSKIIIYPVNDTNYVLSNKTKQDKMVFVQLYLYTSIEPIQFIISQRSDLIQKLETNEFDIESGFVIGEFKEIKKRIDKIRFQISLED